MESAGVADLRDDLLLAAREAIRAQKSPAYIKCSEMRYLAVNEAFDAWQQNAKQR